MDVRRPSEFVQINMQHGKLVMLMVPQIHFEDPFAHHYENMFARWQATSRVAFLVEIENSGLRS